MSKVTTAKKNKKDSTGEFERASEATAGERAALTPAEMLPINLDIELVLATVFGTLARLHAYRDAIVERLPKHDIKTYDKIELYAEALGDAHSAYMTASQPAEPLQELMARGSRKREVMLADATALAKRETFDEKKLQELKGGPGYLNLASDLGVLTKLFRENWGEVSTKTALQLEEIVEAETIRKQILTAYGERAQQSPAVTATTEERQRAYTLLVRAYDQARRALLYLRWDEGDADKIAPSLWAGRGGGRSASSNSAPTVNPPVVNAPGGTTPTPPDVTPKPAPEAPSTAPNVPHEASANHNAAPAVAGSPGGSPFTSN